MGRPPKKSRLSDDEITDKLAQHRSNVKKLIVKVLNECLQAQQVEDTSLIADVEKVLGVRSENVEDPQSTGEGPAEVSTLDEVGVNAEEGNETADGTTTRYYSKRGYGTRTRTSVDEHNEVCEVCEKGGDLLCCDTCTLVFHLKCLRPKMASVPRGEWSCAYCVLDGSAEGDKAQARLAIKTMENVSINASIPPVTDLALSSEGTVIGEFSVAIVGRKFILRKMTKKQIVEIGRYNTLEDALCNIPSVQHVKTELKKKRKIDEQELWCTHCVDDSSIAICAFCGCKACHGKYDSHLLILCDQCERETHTYCLHPPLNAVPSADPWYCESCRDKRFVTKKERQQSLQFGLADGSEHLDGDDFDDFVDRRPGDRRGEGSAQFPHRGRGRPPGSGRKNQLLLHGGGSVGVGGGNDGVRSGLSVPLLGRRRSDSAAVASMVSSDHDQMDDEPAGPVPYSLEAVLQIASEAQHRKLTSRDFESFEGLRRWGRAEDMEQAVQALTVQRDMLLHRLALIAPEIFEEINARLGPFDLASMTNDFDMSVDVEASNPGELMDISLPLNASIDEDMLDPPERYPFGFLRDSRSAEDMLLMSFKEEELLEGSPLMFGIAGGSPRDSAVASSSAQPEEKGLSSDDLLKFE